MGFAIASNVKWKKRKKRARATQRNDRISSLIKKTHREFFKLSVPSPGVIQGWRRKGWGGACLSHLKERGTKIENETSRGDRNYSVYRQEGRPSKKEKKAVAQQREGKKGGADTSICGQNKKAETSGLKKESLLRANEEQEGGQHQ